MGRRPEPGAAADQPPGGGADDLPFLPTRPHSPPAASDGSLESPALRCEESSGGRTDFSTPGLPPVRPPCHPLSQRHLPLSLIHTWLHPTPPSCHPASGKDQWDLSLWPFQSGVTRELKERAPASRLPCRHPGQEPRGERTGCPPRQAPGWQADTPVRQARLPALRAEAPPHLNTLPPLRGDGACR